MPTKPRETWVAWTVIVTTLVLILYPLSIGPALWTAIALWRLGWVSLNTSLSMYGGYATPMRRVVEYLPILRVPYDEYAGWWYTFTFPPDETAIY